MALGEISNVSSPTVKATAAAPSYAEGTVNGLSQDLGGQLRVTDSAVAAAILVLGSAFGSLVVDADGRTIAASETGTIFSNEGASAIDPFILPAAAAGLRFSFMVQDADGIRVTAAAGDTIQIAGDVSAAAGKIESTTIGSAVTLVALNSTEWMALSVVGVWTVT